MMDTTAMVAGGAVGLVVGMAAGLFLGSKVRLRPGYQFWLLAAGVLAVGLAIIITGQVFDSLGFAVAGVGFMGGGFTGLKYGAGRILHIPACQGERSQEP